MSSSNQASKDDAKCQHVIQPEQGCPWCEIKRLTRERQSLARDLNVSTLEASQLRSRAQDLSAERDRLISERDAAIHSAVVEGERGDRLTRELDEMRGSRDRWKRRADDLFFGTNDEAESSPERAGVHKNGDPL